MAYDPGRHHRRTIRLRGYDYAAAGAYYVTICAARRGEVFLTRVEFLAENPARGAYPTPLPPPLPGEGEKI